MILFIAIIWLLLIIRALWPPKTPEIQLPNGCKSLDEYLEVCELWEKLTEKQKQNALEWATRKK